MTSLNVRQNGRGTPARHGVWDPFGNVRGLWGFDPILRDVARAAEAPGRVRVEFAPSFDVIEREDAYLVKADLPGVSESDLDVSVTGNQLTVSGARRAEERGEGDSYYVAERLHGEFSRTFSFPNQAAMDDIEARLESGELTINVPKRAEAQPRKIPIGGGRG